MLAKQFNTVLLFSLCVGSISVCPDGKVSRMEVCVDCLRDYVCVGGSMTRCPAGHTTAAGTGNATCEVATRTVWEHSCNCTGAQQISMSPHNSSCMCVDCAHAQDHSERNGGCVRLLRPFRVELREGGVVTNTNASLFDELTLADGGGVSTGSKTRLSAYSVEDACNISCAIEASKPSVNYFFSVPVDLVAADVYTPNTAVQLMCADVHAYRVPIAPLAQNTKWELPNAVDVATLRNQVCDAAEFAASVQYPTFTWSDLKNFCSITNPNSCSQSKTMTTMDVTRSVNWLQYKAGPTAMGCYFDQGGEMWDRNMMLTTYTDNSAYGPYTKMDLVALGAAWVDGLSFYGSCSRGGYDLQDPETETCAPCPPAHFCPGGASRPVDCNRIPCVGGMWLSGCSATSSGVCEVTTACEHELVPATHLSDRECGGGDTSVACWVAPASIQTLVSTLLFAMCFWA